MVTKKLEPLTTFDQIVSLSPDVIRDGLRHVENTILEWAFAKASPSEKTAIVDALSDRAAAALEANVADLGVVKPEHALLAQRQFVAILNMAGAVALKERQRLVS